MVDGVTSSNVAAEELVRQQEAARASAAAARDTLTKNNTLNSLEQPKPVDQLATGGVLNHLQSFGNKAAAAAEDLQTLTNIQKSATAPIPNVPQVDSNTKLDAYIVPGTLKPFKTYRATTTGLGGQLHFEDTNKNGNLDLSESRYFRADDGRLFSKKDASSTWQKVQTRQQLELAKTLKERYGVAEGTQYDRAQDHKNGTPGHYLTAAGSSKDPSKRYFFDQETQKLYQRDSEQITQIGIRPEDIPAPGVKSQSPQALAKQLSEQKQQLAKDLSRLYKKHLTYLGVRAIPYRDRNGVAKPADAQDEHILQAKNGEKYIWDPDSRTLLNQQGKAETPQLYDFGKSDKWKEAANVAPPATENTNTSTAADTNTSTATDTNAPATPLEKEYETYANQWKEMPTIDPKAGAAFLRRAAREEIEAEARAPQIKEENRKKEQEKTRIQDEERVKDLQGLDPMDINNLVKDRKQAESVENKIKRTETNRETLKKELADLNKRNERIVYLLRKKITNQESLKPEEQKYLEQTQDRWKAREAEAKAKSEEKDLTGLKSDDVKHLVKDRKDADSLRNRIEYLQEKNLASAADIEKRQANLARLDERNRRTADLLKKELRSEKTTELLKKEQDEPYNLTDKDKDYLAKVRESPSNPAGFEPGEREHLEATRARWKNEPDAQDRGNLQRDKNDEEYARERLYEQQTKGLPWAQERKESADNRVIKKEKALKDLLHTRWRASAEKELLDARISAEKATNEVKKIEEDIEKRITHVANLETRNKTTEELLQQAKSEPDSLSPERRAQLTQTRDRWEARTQADIKADAEERRGIAKILYEYGGKPLDLNQKELADFNNVERAIDRMRILADNPPDMNKKNPTREEKQDMELYRRAFLLRESGTEARIATFKERFKNYDELRKISNNQITGARYDALMGGDIFNTFFNTKSHYMAVVANQTFR